jgi:hypothetical protein
MLEYWSGLKKDCTFPNNLNFKFKTDTDLFEFIVVSWSVSVLFHCESIFLNSGDWLYIEEPKLCRISPLKDFLSCVERITCSGSMFKSLLIIIQGSLMYLAVGCIKSNCFVRCELGLLQIWAIYFRYCTCIKWRGSFKKMKGVIYYRCIIICQRGRGIEQISYECEKSRHSHSTALRKSSQPII